MIEPNITKQTEDIDPRCNNDHNELQFVDHIQRYEPQDSGQSHQ